MPSEISQTAFYFPVIEFDVDVPDKANSAN